MLGISNVSVIRLPCSCSECLSKLYYTWNRSQDKYNKDQYKGDNQKCVYWPIIESYNTWKNIDFIESKKHLSLDTEKNVHKNNISSGTLI